MDFAYDATTQDLRERVLAFMDERIYPAEPVFAEQMEALLDPWAWTRAPVIQDLMAEARARGLWNLFLPGDHGAGLTNLQYAPLAEITGRSVHLAPAALNCAARTPEHGGAGDVRHRPAETAVARAVARR
jgi:acyl-CoA dehydrogenase